MDVVMWLVVGGLVGWAASVFMGTDGRQGIVLNVVVGLIGAVIGGWLLVGVFGSGSINQGDFSVSALLSSLIGAIILLFVFKLVRGGALR